MKFGYMPNFKENLFSEIKFCKEHFDFLELTLKFDKKYDIKKMKTLTKNLEIVGHLHWDIDLSENDKGEIRKAIGFINIFKKLNVKKITIHPSYNSNLGSEELIKNNIKSLKKISNFCKKNKIKLFLENNASGILSKPFEIRKILNVVNDIGFTFDVGHSMKNLDEFLKFKIDHVHLHDCRNKKDHLFFNDKNKLKNILDKLRDKVNNITLEIFENKKTMLKQLRICKNLSSK